MITILRYYQAALTAKLLEVNESSCEASADLATQRPHAVKTFEAELLAAR